MRYTFAEWIQGLRRRFPVVRAWESHRRRKPLRERISGSQTFLEGVL